MIDRPGTVVTATRGKEFSFTGSPQIEQAVAAVTQTLVERTGVRAKIDVSEIAERHRGFGSGTQLACAVAAAVARLDGEDDGPSNLAALSGRGQRSAIGLHGFQQGGFLVDAGRREDAVGTIVSRLRFPEEWVILIDRGVGDGLAGQPEKAAFQALAPMPESMTARLCDLTLRAIIPSILDADFETFGPALTEYGRIAGKFFQSAQGGEFVDPTWPADIDSLSCELPVAVAQSSWGPVVAVIAESEAAAKWIIERLPNRKFERVYARNCGATITEA